MHNDGRGERRTSNEHSSIPAAICCIASADPMLFRDASDSALSVAILDLNACSFSPYRCREVRASRDCLTALVEWVPLEKAMRMRSPPMSFGSLPNIVSEREALCRTISVSIGLSARSAGLLTVVKEFSVTIFDFVRAE